MQDAPPWQARICDPRDPARTLGCGVLIDPGLVLCSARALTAAPGEGGEPGGAPRCLLRVELSALAPPFASAARVEGWWPGDPIGSRLAVLRLEAPAPMQAVPARCDPLAPAHYRERWIYCFGYPGAGRGERLHIECAEPDARGLAALFPVGGTLARGFNGTGAWDPVTGALVGLVVPLWDPDLEQDDGVALVPARALLALLPGLRVLPRGGLRARLLRWVAGLDTRRGNRVLQSVAALAALGLAVVWWSAPDTETGLAPDPEVRPLQWLAGSVLDRQGAPVPEAHILIPALGLRADTDRLGRFRLLVPGTPGASVALRALAAGYRSRSGSARLGEVQVLLLEREAH